MLAHRDDLSGVDNFDALVVTLALLQLPLNRSLIAREKELPDFRVLFQRHHRSGDSIAGSIIAPHGVKGDLHEGLSCVHGKDLASLIISACRAGGMSAHTGSALRATGKFRGMPVVGSLAGAQAHLRGFAFWNSHKKVQLLSFLIFLF